LLRLPGELRDVIFKNFLTVGVVFIDPARKPNTLFAGIKSGRKIPFSALLNITSTCSRLRTDCATWPVTCKTFEVHSEDIAIFIERLPQHVHPLIRQIKIERHLRWCVTHWEPKLAKLAALQKLQKVIMLVPPGKDCSRILQVVQWRMMTEAGRFVDVELDTVVKGDPADMIAGRRRLF
jgi:hypothetical protein